MEDLKDAECGQSIFEDLFLLTDEQLKTKLVTILHGNHCGVLGHKCSCVRTIRDMVPEKIEFNFYDVIMVNKSGVFIYPEHGSHYQLIRFDKFFTLQ